MRRRIGALALTGGLIALAPGPAGALTRELAELRGARLTFNRSILNQLTYDTYREPFDELQTRPYNLLFANIGRHSNISPWEGQAGNYRRYFNALIGNNGTANVDNEADSIQGALVRRETTAIAWGLSGAALSGENDSTEANGIEAFADSDGLSGVDVRGAAALQISERRILGTGFRVTQASTEVTDGSFEAGVGGAFGEDSFEQLGLMLDVGVRQFQTPNSSWEALLSFELGECEVDEMNADLDDTGAVVARGILANYDITDMRVGASAGYSRMPAGRIGETEYRVGVEHATRELDNSDLAFTETGGVVTPGTTLVGMDPLTNTDVYAAAKTIIQAGQTELFGNARVAYGMIDGSTSTDTAGVIENEAIDDTLLAAGLTIGVRQPLYTDKIRLIVSGHADLLNGESSTTFSTASLSDDSSLSTSRYAVGIEGVLSNVTFDVAWLAGDTDPVDPVELGLPQGSRQEVQFDRLVFSAAVAW